MRAALAAAGMDAASIAAQVAKAPAPVDDGTELDIDDEGRAASLFLALDTQWNFASTGMVQGFGGHGVRTGLKYEAAAAIAAALELSFDRQVMIDLRVMEAEALKTFAELAR